MQPETRHPELNQSKSLHSRAGLSLCLVCETSMADRLCSFFRSAPARFRGIIVCLRFAARLGDVKLLCLRQAASRATGARVAHTGLGAM